MEYSRPLKRIPDYKELRDLQELIKDSKYVERAIPKSKIGEVRIISGYNLCKLLEEEFNLNACSSIILGNELLEKKIIEDPSRSHYLIRSKKVLYEISDIKYIGEEGVSWKELLESMTQMGKKGAQDYIRLQGLVDFQDKNPLLPPLVIDHTNCSYLDRVRPLKWVENLNILKYDLLILGGGFNAINIAKGSLKYVQTLAILEYSLLGGSYLNIDICLYAIRHYANLLTHFTHPPFIQQEFIPNFTKIMEEVRKKREIVSRSMSMRELREMGIDIYLGKGVFQSSHSVKVNDKLLEFDKCVIATGKRSRIPEINGLEKITYYTKESIFSLIERPKRIIIIGGGSYGCIFAQIFNIFGSTVTILEEKGRILSRYPGLLADVIEGEFQKAGINVLLNARIQRVLHKIENGLDLFKVEINDSNVLNTLGCDCLLVCCGGVPNIPQLNLHNADIAFDLHHGIIVNEYLETTKSNIYAYGEVSNWKLNKHSHISNLVLNNLFALHKKSIKQLVIPAITVCTIPEFVLIGSSFEELSQLNIPFDLFEIDFECNLQNIIQNGPPGLLKIFTKKNSDKVLGATLIGNNAIELVGSLSQIMENGLSSALKILFPINTYSFNIRKIAEINELYLKASSGKLLNK